MAKRILDTTLFTGRIQRAPAPLASQVSPVSLARTPARHGPSLGVPFLNKALSRRERVETLRVALTAAKERAVLKGTLKLTAPTNLEIYVTAYDGALAGMAGSRLHGGISLDTYAQIATTAGSWAEAFDLTWGSATALNEVEAEICLLASFGYWNGRSANSGSFLQVGGVISSIIDLMGAAILWFDGQSISPPTWNT